MAAQWFYAEGDKQIGPISESDIKSLARSGRLKPDDLVWNASMADWSPVRNIKGLLCPAAPPPRTDATGTPPGAAATAAPAKKTIRIPASALSSFVSVAKAGAQFAARKAERTMLATVTLPAAYRTLGEHRYQQHKHRSDFPDVYRQLDELATQIADARSREHGPSSPRTLRDKARSVGSQGALLMQAKQLSLRQASLFSLLGKAIYERHQAAGGPQAIIEPVETCLARLAALDAEIANLSSQREGHWVTPRRAAYAGTLIACLFLIVGIGYVISPQNGRLPSSNDGSGEHAVSSAQKLPQPTTPSNVGTREHVESDVSKQHSTDTIDAHGPNGEDVLIGGDGPGTDWFFHYYVDKNGNKVMHGASRVQYNGKGRRESIYDQGVLIERAVYDPTLRLEESFKRLPDGTYENDEYRTVSSGATMKFRSIVKIAKTDTGETMSEVEKRRLVDDTPLAAVAGRRLNVSVNTVGIEHKIGFVKQHNMSLKSLECTATDGELIIDFDVDASKWVSVNMLFPLLVRLFDRNGQYLTHFTTAEGFTVSVGVFLEYDAIRKRWLDARVNDEADKYKSMLLKAKSNRLVYSVNVRDLRDAAIVEVGFTER